MEDGEQPYLIVSLDILLFEREFAQRVTKTLYQEMNLPAENIILSATHTHSAPAIHDFLNVGHRDPQWENAVEEKIYLTAFQAQKKACRAQADWNHTSVTLGMNRRQAGGAFDPTFSMAFFINS